MAQITTGLRRILSIPFVYDFSQAVFGANRSRRRLARDHFRISAGQRIVDVGCGTGQILNFLPREIEYHGFDLDPNYIETARARHGDRGRFDCADITTLPAEAIPPCDLAIAVGLLHHLDDDGARALLTNLARRLAPGGRLLTIDGVWEAGQSPIARAILARDRGQNVRDASGYLALVPDGFASSRLTVRHDLMHIPYSHAVMECTK